MPTPIADGRPLRWGILGAGGIADTVSNDINLTEGNVVTAVAARDADRAARFAARHGAARSYGDYTSLVDDDQVDVVYVSTTHPHHRAHALMAIEAGKAVLIEKPVCLNAADAREVFAAATQAGVFAMEAMWTRTNPLIRKAQQLIADGAIGEVRGVRNEFGLGLPFDPNHRLYELANGGGALLDLGVYPVTFAYLFMGPPDEVRTVGTLSPTGSDETVAMQWMYGDHPGAQLWTSAPIHAPNEAAILGSKGWISFLPEAYRPTGLVLHTDAGEEHTGDPLAGHGNGYGPEIEEVERCLRAGLLQSPLIPHADTIAILEILDDARGAVGVVYPGNGDPVRRHVSPDRNRGDGMASVAFGLVGYGFGGRYFHAPLITSAPECDLIGVMTSSPERQALVAREIPGTPTFTSLNALRDAGVEAVAISTPADTHSSLTEQALELGLAVVCDKPFALDPDAARRTVALADERGSVLSPYQNRRWDSDFLHGPKAGVRREARYGDPLRVRASNDSRPSAGPGSQVAARCSTSGAISWTRPWSCSGRRSPFTPSCGSASRVSTMTCLSL